MLVAVVVEQQMVLQLELEVLEVVVLVQLETLVQMLQQEQ
jgi:hypothetical protein